MIAFAKSEMERKAARQRLANNRAYPGGHVARISAPIDAFIRKLVIARMSRDDAAGLIAVPDNGIDVTALREESAAIRRNLDEMAADRALGLIDRAQLIAATGRASHRLTQISDQLTQAGRENVLTELVTATSVTTTWDQMDLSRQRAVINTLMTITVHSPGKGTRRDFDPATITIHWHEHTDNHQTEQADREHQVLACT
jgi:site-specific DNA recombinase